jgi:hypothetical protein
MTNQTTTADEYDWAADDDGMGDTFQFGQLSGTLHATPGGDGLMPCCGRGWESLPRGEGYTSDPDGVQCAGRVPA